MNAEEELKRLRELQKNDWEDLRSPEKYILQEVKIPDIGTRKVYVFDKWSQLKSQYEDLQSSRGVVSADTIEEMIKIQNSYGLTSADNARIIELGFRFPKLLEFYRNRFQRVKGCDITDLSVAVGTMMNYDVVKCDLSRTVPNVMQSSLVVAYHVLEHISDPHETIKRLYDLLPNDSYFHVEIPIEPGIPRIRYAHLFAFEKGDVTKMCRNAGFMIVKTCNDPYEGGPEIERCLCRKN